MLTMLESLNYSFRNPKNIFWVIYRIKQLRNYKKDHGVLRGPQLDKQRWRARFGILRVNANPKSLWHPHLSKQELWRLRYDDTTVTLSRVCHHRLCLVSGLVTSYCVVTFYTNRKLSLSHKPTEQLNLFEIN